MPVPWGAIMGGVGLGATALGSMYDRETPGEIGSEWLQNPQYPWAQGNQQYLSQYYNQGLANLQAGKAPQWYQMMEQAQKPRQKQNLYQTYFGGNWGPGIMDVLKSYQVQRGTPAGKAPGMMGRQLSDYATQSKAIDEFFTTGAASAMQGAEGMYLQGMQGMPQGPSGQWMGWQTPASYQPSWLSSMGTAMTGMAPYYKDIFGGG